jgi:hypothetical protein
VSNRRGKVYAKALGVVALNWRAGSA